MSARECDICKHRWIFNTDWLGRVYAIHDPRPCVPPVYAYEPEDIRPRKASKPIKCVECGGVFTPNIFASRSVKICSSACRMARRTRLRNERSDDEKWWEALKRKQRQTAKRKAA